MRKNRRTAADDYTRANPQLAATVTELRLTVVHARNALRRGRTREARHLLSRHPPAEPHPTPDGIIQARLVITAEQLRRALDDAAAALAGGQPDLALAILDDQD